MPVFADPIDALQELVAQGDPDSIAQFLLGCGVRGQRRVMCECPIALWLGRRTCLTFVVENDNVWLWPNDWATVGESDDLALQRWTLPDAVGRFISRFDDGLYPELEI